MTGTSIAPATAAASSTLNPAGWWKSGRVCSAEKIAPAHDDDVVDALGDQRGGDVRGHLRRDPRPRRQLVARQAQPDDARRADRRPHGGDHVAGEPQPVGTPLVVAVVGQPRQELADEAVLAGVHLDAVAPGVPRDPCRLAEAGDDGGDVVRLHPLRHLAGDDLGHP